MATYRIDEIARMADLTVRNVRAFHEQGLLHSPRREGRIGLYDDSHLARIRLIGQLQERGYTRATIAELISAWEGGHDLAEVLGLEKALTDPWSDEEPGHLTPAELADLYYPGPRRADLNAMPQDEVLANLARAEALGFIEPAEGGYRIPSPRLLNVGAELVAAGIPLPTVFDIAERLGDDCDAIARRFVQLTVDQANLDDLLHYTVRKDLPEVTDLITRLRPLALRAVEGLLAQSMETQIRARFSEQIEKIARRTDT